MNTKYAAPRYWSVWVFWGWLRFMAVLPLGISFWIHERIGGASYYLAGKSRHVTRRNLELCFPELDQAAIDRLVRQHFRALGASVAEMAAAWFTPERRLAKRFDIVGTEYLNAAMAEGRGVILFTGHFTTLEICGHPLKRLTPLLACMYSHRSNALLDDIQLQGRLRNAHEAISRNDVRSLLRNLKRNAVIWYAPDRRHDGANAELMPFFHELAKTNTATSRIARVSNAVILPFSYKRLPGQLRYELRFHEPLPGIPSDDMVEDTRRLCKQLEQFIRDCPEQYMWTHSKYKGRPTHLPNVYERTKTIR